MGCATGKPSNKNPNGNIPNNQNVPMQAANQPGQYYQGNIQNSNLPPQTFQQQGQYYQENMMDPNHPFRNQNLQNPQYNANQQQYAIPPSTTIQTNTNAGQVNTNQGQVNTNTSQINFTANQPLQNVTSPYKNPNDLGYQTPNSSQIVQQQGSQIKPNITNSPQRQSIENIQMRSPQQSGLKPNFNDIHNSTQEDEIVNQQSAASFELGINFTMQVEVQ